MKKLSDYVIISDVDGTLLPYTGILPKRNIEALTRFTAKGGRFGIATGRSKELTEEFAKSLPVNAPCVVYNGGGLYDFTAQKFLMREYLPESAREILKQIRTDLPRTAVLVITEGNYYHVTREIPFTSFSDTHRKIFRDAAIEQLTQPWYKVLFAAAQDEVSDFFDYVNSQKFDGVRFVSTNATLIEMLPACSTKGYALSKLVELGVFERENIVAVGDYYNDVEMIEFAGIGAATREAPDELKAKADFITGPCEGGALADLLEYLERITGYSGP